MRRTSVFILLGFLGLIYGKWKGVFETFEGGVMSEGIGAEGGVEVLSVEWRSI